MSQLITVAIGASIVVEADPERAPELRLGGEWSVEAALEQAARQFPQAEFALVVAETEIVDTGALVARAHTAIDRLAAKSAPWFCAAPEGVDVANGEELTAMYDSADPRLSRHPLARPVVAPTTTPLLVSIPVFRALRRAHRDGTIADLARDGYVAGIPSWYLPELGAARLKPPRIAAATFERGDLHREGLELMWSRWSDLPSFSIVTRTTGRRPHLLRRLAVSLVRSLAAVDVELEWIVVGRSEAITRADAALSSLGLEAQLKVTMVGHDRVDLPDRVINLIEGVEAATGDYVWFVDDDDFLIPEAWREIREAFVAGQRPALALTSSLVEERWEFPPTGRPVIAGLREVGSYPAADWKVLFRGWNSLPICSLALPATVARQVMAGWDLTADLSEDYFLFLRLFTSAEIPPIFEVAGPCVGISLRPEEDSNTVTASDRSGWLRDISSAIVETLVGPHGGGRWQMMAATRSEDPVQRVSSEERLREAVAERDRQLEAMAAELMALQAQKSPPAESLPVKVSKPPPTFGYRVRRKLRHLFGGRR